MKSPEQAVTIEQLAAKDVEIAEWKERALTVKNSAEELIRKRDAHNNNLVGQRHALEHQLAALRVGQNRLLQSLCWALRQLQGDTGTGDSHWQQFPEYVAAVEVARSLGGDVAHSPPVSVCDHYRHKALQVVIDWDGQDTIELFNEIVKTTGESETLPQALRSAST
jgi:hypothetical protein